MGLASIFIAIVLLWILAYKGWSTLWLAPLAAAIVGIFGGMNLLDMYTNTYMTGFANFAVVRAVCGADDPYEAIVRLQKAFGRQGPLQGEVCHA